MSRAVLYGDGQGNFSKTVLVSGHGWHEGRLGDFDGDGDIDVLNKPYTWNAPRLDLWLNDAKRETRGDGAPVKHLRRHRHDEQSASHRN